MRSFWGFYDNGEYKVGCNGTTIYLYDRQDNEVAKFRDISYAYTGVFKPGSNIFVAKSVDRKLAVYDLDSRTLVKKIHVKPKYSQDEGIAFTEDGKYLYNIESACVSTQLTIYDGSTFEIDRILFKDNGRMVLQYLEFDGDRCYVTGFMRGDTESNKYYFVGEIIADEIQNMKKISSEQYWYLISYKAWETEGFTEKGLEWGMIGRNTDRPRVTIKEYMDK